MSLFHYKVQLSDGSEKTGKITAKDEAAARQRVAEQKRVAKWHWIKAQPDKVVAARKESGVFPSPLGAAAKLKPLSKLEKLLYLQSGKCFFCGHVIDKADASIEHIHPRSKGGKDSDDNTSPAARG